jgi:hypothetical protein
MATLSLCSCYDLDRYPQDQLTQGTFWKTDEQAKEGIMGVYAGLRYGYAFGIYWANDVLSDIAFGYDDNVGMQSVVQNAFDANSAHVTARWQHTYDAIRKANTAIRNVQNATGLSAEVQKEVLAEGKFLRALLYFHLTNYFGGVPIYDETVDYDKDYMSLQSKRSTLEEVRAFIMKDLTDAIADFLLLGLLPITVVLLAVLLMLYVVRCISSKKTMPMLSRTLKKSSRIRVERVTDMLCILSMPISSHRKDIAPVR